MKKHKVLILYQAYILVAFLIFYFGPIDYPKKNITETITLLILYNIAFILGYHLAYSHTILYKKKFKKLKIGIKSLIAIGLLLSIYLSVSYLVAFAGSFNFFSDVIAGITNPGEAYQKNILIEDKASVLTKLATLFAPLTYAVIPLSIIYYRKLSLITKLLFFMSIVLAMSTYLIKGTNFLIIFLAITILISSSLAGVNIEKIRKIGLSKKILFSFAIFYFFFSISSRMLLTSIPTAIYQINVNQEHIIFKLPETISIPLMLGTSYISQGYYGLSLAPSFDFPNTLGLGNGVFIMGKLDEQTRIDIWNSTYQAQMETIWDPRIHWHTAYLWFANDVSLYGVIIIMTIIGFFFSLVLRDAYQNKSLLAIILLPLYTIMLLFTPSNNIIFNSPMMFMSFIFFNILWVLSKKWRFK